MPLRSRRSKTIRRDSELFVDGLRSHEAQKPLQDALKRGFQTRDKELNLAAAGPPAVR